MSSQEIRYIRLADILSGAGALVFFSILGLGVDYAHWLGGPDFFLALDLQVAGFLVFFAAIALSVYLER